jgi:hypothetical protein
MTSEDSELNGKSNFGRDVAPDPRSIVTESAFAKLSFAYWTGEKMLAGGA